MAAVWVIVKTVIRRLFDQWAAGGELPQIAKLIGFRLAEYGPDRTVMEFESGPQHANPMGSLHGGVLCDVADAAMGTAWATRLEDGESFTTIELKINFFRPVWNAKLTAAAQVVRRGKTLGYIECDVRDEAGNLVARAACSCMTLRGEQAKGR
jgi:uncharacterized protein (TIGR00369 family)